MFSSLCVLFKKFSNMLNLSFKLFDSYVMHNLTILLKTCSNSYFLNIVDFMSYSHFTMVFHLFDNNCFEQVNVKHVFVIYSKSS